MVGTTFGCCDVASIARLIAAVAVVYHALLAGRMPLTVPFAESAIALHDDAIHPAACRLDAYPRYLWSVLDMIEKFSLSDVASFLVDFERTMAGFEIFVNPLTDSADAQSFVELAIRNFDRTLNGVVQACRDGQVPLSYPVVLQIKDFADRLSSRRDSASHPVLLEHARVTRHAILNDLSQHTFLYVHIDSARFYSAPLAGWDAVVERFGCSFDIEEARKSYALGRYTASVFHLMKVVESAVLELQVFLQDQDVKAHFGSVIAKLENMTQKTKYEHVPTTLQPHVTFMREVLAQLHAVKDSWRNKVSHVDAFIVPVDTFTQELARGVHDATLLLMKKLASGLPR